MEGEDDMSASGVEADTSVRPEPSQIGRSKCLLCMKWKDKNEIKECPWFTRSMNFQL